MYSFKNSTAAKNIVSVKFLDMTLKSLHKSLYEQFAAWTAHDLCKYDANEWNQVPNFEFPAVIASVEIEQSPRDFVFISISLVKFFGLLHVGSL